ncbi:MAG: hypothetical protein QOH24_370 [Verrucomicrobiota bacterium]|jgi:rhodanese-related sulfurtransferase
MANRFERLVAEARKNVTEMSPQETARTAQTGKILIIDVRDDEESSGARVPNAKRISRGTLEIEIEEIAPDTATPIVCYCGGGGRSALAPEEPAKNGLHECEVDGRGI